MADTSIDAKKVYLNKMSQHFKEIAESHAGSETQRVIANTLSKNADIMADIYSIIEKLTLELRYVKSENEQLRQMILQMKK
ncbi:MAG TPA: hypothetical protein VE524_09320 [Nitrososphaeraceae archaeon]|jgi:hypothetical protein|nr:hypothetical protein [Nitrososphaeraceae archaeon]